MKYKIFLFLFISSFIFCEKDNVDSCFSLMSQYKSCLNKSTEDCRTELNKLLDCMCSQYSELNAFRCCRAREARNLLGKTIYPCVKCVSYKPAKEVFKNVELPNPDYPIKTYTFRSAYEGGCLDSEIDEGCHLRPSECLRPGKNVIGAWNKGVWGSVIEPLDEDQIFIVEEELVNN